MIIDLVCSLVVDHLVNNAGVASVCWFEKVPDVADFKQVLVWFLYPSTVLPFAKLPLQMEATDLFLN